jgi:hypothetical protein
MRSFKTLVNQAPITQKDRIFLEVLCDIRDLLEANNGALGVMMCDIEEIKNNTHKTTNKEKLQKAD